jgi:hypothetical protein
MATALTVVDTHANVEAYRASTNAAEICKEIVVATASEIQGRRYVAVEGWQAIAVAHGCTASSRDVERVEGGVKAVGEVRRMSDGALIATAEGFVGEDEPTWFGGTMKRWKWGQKRGEKIWYDEEMPKRPDYAIRAMAQTRAISRACRSAFAHVVVMMKEGLATTPAEEVPFEGFDQGGGEVVNARPTRANNDSEQHEMPDEEYAHLVQLIEASGSDTNWLVQHYKVKNLRQLSMDQYTDASNRLRDKLAKMAKQATDAKARQASGGHPANEFADIDADSIPY